MQDLHTAHQAIASHRVPPYFHGVEPEDSWQLGEFKQENASLNSGSYEGMHSDTHVHISFQPHIPTRIAYIIYGDSSSIIKMDKAQFFLLY